MRSAHLGDQNAPTEVERKFLVAEEALVPMTQAPGERLQQGYLVIGSDCSEARIRMSPTATTLTVKSGSGLVRFEYEIEIDGQQFAELWPATAGRRIIKTRHSLSVAGHIADLDVYEGAHVGLRIVEVEFTSVSRAHAFSPPSWFGTEVTNDERFRNQSLALQGGLL